ncbi:MAG: DsrH/TusB family sulfur metabolism protein [Promethearchaeota archaeon]
MEGYNNLIYLYGYSSKDNNLFDHLLKIIKEQIPKGARISIVLIHDGVIGTSKRSMISNFIAELLRLSINIYAMIPDLNARGIDPKDLRNQVIGISYEDLVDILVEATNIISWM